jgi:hypothetical protein
MEVMIAAILFFIIGIIVIGCRTLTKRIERLERAVQELNPGLDLTR